MKVSVFDYHLPQELIARYPAAERVQSRLLALERSTGKITHHFFYELPEFLFGGDLLVLNNSRVIAARLIGHRLPGGGRAEVLLLKQKKELLWEAMVKPGKKIHVGDRIIFDPKILEGIVEKHTGRGERLIRFECRGNWNEVLARIGHIPLPPYILKARRDDLHTDMAHTPLEEPEDRKRYQTVFARTDGSVAAPTAGLHFSEKLLHDLNEMGVEQCLLTLHIGASTFQPVKTVNVEDHEMHSESFLLDKECAGKINCARSRGHRIVAVGTTVVRTIESCAGDDAFVTAGNGETRLMITPGCNFRCVDALITNFHLPKSTLLMLVCAFGGTDKVLKAYEEAVKEGYRFYSYGDAMLLY